MIYILSMQQSFTITQAESAPGKVKGVSTSPFVKREGRNLILNGKPFRSVGVNRYNLLTQGGSPYIGCAGAFSDADLASWFAELRQMGVTSVRFWMFQNFTQGGENLSKFEYVLSLAEKNDIKLIPVFENQWDSCTEGGYKTSYWYKEGYKNPYGGNAISYKGYVGNIVTKYRNTSTIMMWQLMNEAEADHHALYQFAEDMGAFIKSIDKNHLVSLGTIGSGQEGASGSEFRTLHAIPSIDVIGYHDYHYDTLPFPDYDNYNSLKVRFSDAITLDKPIIVSESGIKANCTESDCHTPSRRAELFRAKMTEFFKRGGAAYLLWSYRDHAGSPVREYDFTSFDPLTRVIKQQSASL